MGLQQRCRASVRRHRDAAHRSKRSNPKHATLDLCTRFQSKFFTNKYGNLDSKCAEGDDAAGWGGDGRAAEHYPRMDSRLLVLNAHAYPE